MLFAFSWNYENTAKSCNWPICRNLTSLMTFWEVKKRNSSIKLFTQTFLFNSFLFPPHSSCFFPIFPLVSLYHRLAKNTLTSALRRCALLPLEQSADNTDYPRALGPKNRVAVSTVSALVRGAEEGARMLRTSHRGVFVVEDNDRAGERGNTQGRRYIG